MDLLHEGQTVRGTYEVERFLGAGAFAEVWRVQHPVFGRQAMKVFKMVGLTIKETGEMLNEALLLSEFRHENIIRVFEANTSDTSKGVRAFFTMDYVAQSLEQFWKSYVTQFVPVDIAVDIIQQVCRGLAVAHGSNPPIIHRDIKPQNILIGLDKDRLRVRVSDFGLAKRVNPLTMLATGVGTRCFKAPEVFRDFKSDSCAGDVWAIGTTLYLLLTDRLPFMDIDNLDRLDLAAFERPLIPPSRINFHVDLMLDQIVFRALALEAKDRYPSAREMLADLKKWGPRRVGGGGKAMSSQLTSDKSKIDLRTHLPSDKLEIEKIFGSEAETSKLVVNEARAREMAERAVRLARDTGRLSEAANLMEKAFEVWPDLRGQYEFLLSVWRRGVAM
jgi:eukaryotic-like serine/threonine-protein kinase